ncbi:hypothetical protein [Streptomyces tsukubensis]|uniref:Uncharacterized protein n=1 Tax=Streptomyces tsukubensis TaxID=83656 RepID=A0A1V4AFB8_9ACTN|nr:hypothetical protein [Streptomyces tsukubensis]OON82346.1 hypothetical protein B1H18_04835 [Streptomyces tsukubensis]QFR92842.1 hypothetical protein GBW32_06860 [Streptomyces tsukubensis]
MGSIGSLGSDSGFGHPQVRGIEAQAFAHLTEVTEVTGPQARQRVRAAFDLRRKRFVLPPGQLNVR